MNSLDRHVSWRTLIIFAAMLVLGLSSIAARRVPKTNPGGQTPAGTGSNAAVQSAKEVRGATPYLELQNEPEPKLIVDPPLQELLDRGVVWIQWRVENLNVVPVFGKGALNVSPRVGHLHVHVDDLPWWWADASNINTIDLAGMPPGPHKIRIELVNATHEVFPGQSRTVHFTVPKGASRSHAH